MSRVKSCASDEHSLLKVPMLPTPVGIDNPGVSKSEFSPITQSFCGDISPLSKQNSVCTKEWRAILYYKRRCYVLIFSEETDKLVMLESPKCTNGVQKVLLEVPMCNVLNMETSDERATREFQCRSRRKIKAQQVRFITKNNPYYFLSLNSNLVDPNFNTHMLIDNENKPFDSTTLSSNSRRRNNFECTQSLIRGDYEACKCETHYSLLRNPISETQLTRKGGRRTGHQAEDPRLTHFFLYYVSLSEKIVKKCVREIEFCVLEDPYHLKQALNLQNAVLQRVYGAKPKTLEVFISPKSGKGDGESIFRESLRPILDVTRHRTKWTITKRAHECEDFVADLKNPLDENYVVVVIGGDGMVQEAVNGLHRRRLALIAQMREECKTAELMTPPLNVSSGVSSFQGGPSPVLSRKDDGTDVGENVRILQPSSASRRGNEAQKKSSTSSLTPVFDSLLRYGWDALVPLIATVPSGSGCGLAKALDVLDPMKAVLALVQHKTCRLSLLSMKFKRNVDLFNCHWKKWTSKKRAAATKEFASYLRSYSKEIKERLAWAKAPTPPQPSFASRGVNDHTKDNKSDSTDRCSQYGSELEKSGLSLKVSTSLSASIFSSTKGSSSPSNLQTPYFKDGIPLYTDPVSYKLGAPEFQERVAFMSLSFGLPNDIDRGSEPLRFLGNTRFAVFAAFTLMSGAREYKATIRYLPWIRDGDRRLENVDVPSDPASLSHFSFCTMQDNCPNCQKYADPCPNGLELLKRFQAKALGTSGDSQSSLPKGAVPQACRDTEGGVEAFLKAADGVPAANIPSSSSSTSAQRRLLMSCSDNVLLQEDQVDFDSESLPWETLSGEFVAILICNLSSISQNMFMAPYSHLSDGAIDIVFVRSNPKDPVKSRITRADIFHFFNGLEGGTHIQLPKTSYIKARAIEVKVDSGISMADGEMMPLSSVRLTKIRDAVRVVRFN